MLTKEQITKIVQFAETHQEIAAVYLFGSHASGRAKLKSDIDLGVLFFSELDPFARVDLETEISNLLSKEVDLVDMRKSSPVLRHQIYKYGILLYHKEEFPFHFRANSIRDYLDTAYLRKFMENKPYGE